MVTKKKSTNKKAAPKKAEPVDVFMQVSGMNREGATLLADVGFTSVAEFGEEPVMKILFSKIFEGDLVDTPEKAQRLLNCIKLCKLQAVKSDEKLMREWEGLLEERGITTKVAWTLLMAGINPKELRDTSLNGVYDTVMSKSDVSFRQLQDLYLSLVTNKLDAIKSGKREVEELPGPYSRIPGP